MRTMMMIAVLASVFKVHQVNINNNRCTIFLCSKFIGVFFIHVFSLRAQFGSDAMRNAVHGSSSVEKAEKAIKEFFPEVEILPDGTVKGLSLLFITSCASCVPSVFLSDTKNAVIHPYDHLTK